jgi:predicted amidophosphoribosyltransferase
MYNKLCPKCNKPHYESAVYCSDDGIELLPFYPKCECGELINSYFSYIYNQFYGFSIHFPFIYDKFTPEALGGNNCDKCGRNIKQQYKTYLKQWRIEHPYKFIKEHTLLAKV